MAESGRAVPVSEEVVITMLISDLASGPVAARQLLAVDILDPTSLLSWAGARHDGDGQQQASEPAHTEPSPWGARTWATGRRDTL